MRYLNSLTSGCSINKTLIMPEPLLTIENLDAGYKTRQGNIVVVGGVNTKLYGGEVVALVGRNGAGKSTLLRTLASFQKPLSGAIFYSAASVSEMSAVEVARIISVVLTENHTHSLTARELIALGRTPYTNLFGHLRSRDNDVIEEAIEMMGVSAFADRMVDTLSDGERQKCMIAKALAQETPIMLFDEPTAFLDYQSKVALFKLLKSLAVRTGKAILVSTHDVELAVQLADKLWIISSGKMYAGTVDELSMNGVMNHFVDDENLHYDSKGKKIEIL